MAPGGIGLGYDVRRNLNELPYAGQLGVHECAGSFADMARDAGHAGVRRPLPGHELRLHRGVARLPAEGRRFHVVQATVAAQQDNHEVDGGKRRDEERRPADAAAPEVEDGPVFRVRIGMSPQPALLKPHARRDEQQARDEYRGDGHEHDQPCIRIGEHARERRDQQCNESHG